MKRIKRRIKWKNVFLLLIILICIIILSISAINILKSKINSNKTIKQINKVQTIVEIVEIEDNSNIEIITPEEEFIEEDNPYWDYIKMNLIDVDFRELKKVNSDTNGWIQVNGTNINYPFVQTKNNDFYLTHSFDKSYNQAGWVFLDYRNDIDNDKNIILYAHSMLDKTMFGSLRNILKSDWLNNTDNYVIKLSTENENTLWQVFSIYHIPTTTDYLKTTFNTNIGFVNFANILIERSVHNFNTSVNENDRILTLSTCYNKTEKVVVHAKLIKKEKKS